MEKIISKALDLVKERYYEVHLAIINPLLPVKMTPKEIEVLAHFMSLTGDIANDRFGTSARKIVKKNLGLSDGGLGNYFKALRDKGCIIENDTKVNPILIAQPKEQKYNFKLTNIDFKENGIS